MAIVAQPDVIERLLPLFEEARDHAVVVSDGKAELGAIVSMKDYEIVRRVKTQRVLQALDSLGKETRDKALNEGISLAELERMLDRRAR